VNSLSYELDIADERTYERIAKSRDAREYVKYENTCFNGGVEYKVS